MFKGDDYKESVLLVTGGTGSFGSTVATKFLDTDLKEIRIFSRDEKKQDDMRKMFNNDKLKFYIGDVRNIDSVRAAMKGVDYVFHAAALKQVPSCEFFPMEAMQTNVIGTDNVLTAAIDAKVKSVVCLSTDKAAYPINAMGISKALEEKVAIAKSRNLSDTETVISCTRYGNIMCSRGSVIPLFIDQALNNADLTITDPEMTRFLMNLDESVDLVMFALEHACQGDLFIQKAPASTIADLGKAVIKLFNSQSKLRVIGVRHGEKAHETLMTYEEAARAVDMGKYYRIPADTRDLNYSNEEVGHAELSSAKEYTSANTERLDVDSTIAKILTSEYVQRVVDKIKLADTKV
jgi:UDP-glucose 4-epimerase